MKKILTTLCAIAILSSMSITSFAADSTDKTSKEERKAFKESVAVIKQEVKDNRAQLKEIAAENKAMCLEYKEILKANKASETPTITPETLAQVNTLVLQLKDVRAELAGTKGQVKEALSLNKENMKNMDYEAVVDAVGEATDIQDSRLEDRVAINSILKQILALLK